jgi:hypothetical protein
MSKWIIAAIGVFGIGILTVLIVGSTWISYHNRETILRNAISAQVKSNSAEYDEMWKKIAQLSQVYDRYKDGFKEIYIGMMEGRYSKGDGTLMKWITESNPTFDSKLYDRVANAIEGGRASFTESQNRLIDLGREHDNMLMTFPGNVFLFYRDRIDIKVITSSRTEEVFKTGIDDNISIDGSTPQK